MELKYIGGLVFRPLGQICDVTQKGFWKQVSSYHKKMAMNRTKKPSSPMDLWHCNTTMGAPHMWDQILEVWKTMDRGPVDGMIMSG